MPANRTVKEQVEGVSGPLWWAGWRPLVTPLVGGFAGLALGNAIAIPVAAVFGLNTLITMAACTLAGVFAGIGGWYWGTQQINDGFRSVLDAYQNGTTESEAAESTYALVAEGKGTKPRLAAHRRYRTTYVVLGDSSLSVYGGSIDLKNRQPKLDGRSVEIPYDRIDSIVSDDSTVKIQTTGDDHFRYDSVCDPIDLVCAVRERLSSDA